jgi:hypothetical protein
MMYRFFVFNKIIMFSMVIFYYFVNMFWMLDAVLECFERSDGVMLGCLSFLCKNGSLLSKSIILTAFACLVQQYLYVPG